MKFQIINLKARMDSQARADYAIIQELQRSIHQLTIQQANSTSQLTKL